jgi:hypothetical protein
MAIKPLYDPGETAERRNQGIIPDLQCEAKMMARIMVNKRVGAVGEQYIVEPFTNVGPDSHCDLYYGWVNIVSKCSQQHLIYGDWTGPEQSSKARCNVVGSTSK